LSCASAILREKGSRDFSVDEVAQRAGVQETTVEYFFDSPTQLIGEAQLANYFTLVKSHHLVQLRVEDALANQDLDAFDKAVQENLELAWSSGQVGNRWGIFELLHDIWSDPFSQSHFCELLDIQFERWISVIQEAQRLGWIEDDIDPKALVSVFWSSSVGQVITAGSTVLNVTPKENRDFIMRIVRPPSRLGARA
jgi:AcrR family transcriptional regulator